jgi:hypothetical protein
VCKLKLATNIDEDEFESWFEEHKESCSINYSGSSNAMEVEGVKALWLRSVADLKLRYCIVDLPM